MITFALGGTATFGTVSVTGSTTSFQMSPTGFLAVTSQVYDTGTVTLTVGGVTAATTNYGADATPSTIAAGLAAGVTVGSFVNVTAVNDGLYLVAKQQGAGTNYSYSIQDTSNNPAVFTQPSFGSTPGNLDGGANAGTAGQTQSIYSFAGTYDGVGNLLSYADSVMGNWAFTFDSLNRLVTGTSSSGAYNGKYNCWAYDSFGNRIADSLQSAACPTSETGDTQTTTYNANNQVTATPVNIAVNGFIYDAAGDVTNDNLNQYLYDAEGRICAVSSRVGGATGYIYGADGTRVAKGTITSWSCDPSVNGFTPVSDYILGPSNEQVTELDMDPNQGVMAWQHTNVWAGGKLLATYAANGLHFYFDDPLGTRRAQTDYAGVLEQTCQSLPFGDGETCATTPTEHLFTGKERDQESGNDYFGARYYASSMGRFMSPDWDSDPFPIPYASLEDPQTLNLYSYVQNNPMSSRDPDGHASYQDNGNGQLTWQGDYDGERDCSGSAGCLFWNKSAGEWQGSDPNPPPPGDPAGDAFTGFTRMMLSSSWGDFNYGFRSMFSGYAGAFKNGPTPLGVVISVASPLIPIRLKKSGLSGKEGSKDIPSWAQGSGPQGNENGKQYAKRMMDSKYGEGNWSPSSQEFSQLKKYGDRSFVAPERAPEEPGPPEGPID